MKKKKNTRLTATITRRSRIKVASFIPQLYHAVLKMTADLIKLCHQLTFKHMPIHAAVKGKIKEAMLAKDTVKLTVVKSLVAAFTNELVAKGKKPQGEVTDEEATVVIRRSVKQHKDSIEQFEKGGRKDLVKEEKAELDILETFLPKLMSKDDIKKIAAIKKTELGISEKSKSGQLMSVIMKELKGRADGADVKSVVDELLA